MWSRLGLLVLGTIVGLLLAEAGARLVYTEPWYDRLVAEQGASDRRVLKRVSRWGLRDQDYPIPKPPGRERVLFLGDSFTVGEGVPDIRDIFPEIIERRLNEEAARSGADGVDVLNGGQGGSVTTQWVKLWNRIAEEFDPDVVVAVFFLRDGTRTAAKTDFFGPIRERLALRNRDSALYQHWYLYRIFQDRVDRIQVGHQYERAFHFFYFGNEEQTAEWRTAQRNLLYLRDAADARSTVFGLVVFPVLAGLDENYAFKAICDLVEQFARDNEIPVHDLLPAFLGRDAGDLWVSALNQHPNPTGHAIAAESMLPFVEDLLEKSRARHRASK